MEAQYGKTRYLREVGWWKNQICRGRESRKAQGAPGRGSGGSSRRQASYSAGLLLFAEARGRRSLSPPAVSRRAEQTAGAPRLPLYRMLVRRARADALPIPKKKEFCLSPPPQLFLVKVNIRDCAAQSQATLHEAQPCRGVVGEL